MKKNEEMVRVGWMVVDRTGSVKFDYSFGRTHGEVIEKFNDNNHQNFEWHREQWKLKIVPVFALKSDLKAKGK